MALGWLATRGLMGYGAYEVDKQVFGGWTWDKLVNGVKDIGRSILEDDNAPPAAPGTNATTSTTTDPNAASTASPASEEEGSTLDHLKDTATRTRDQLADGDYLGALSTVAGATRGDEPDADNDDDDGWSWWQKTLAVFAGGYTGKKVLWDWTLSNFFGGDDNNNDNNNNGSGWFGKLMTAGIVIGAVITAAMHWKELKGMATSAFNAVTGNDNAPSADVSSTNTYSSEQISAYFKNTAAQDTTPTQPALDTSASLFGSALGGAASAQINQPNPSNVNLDASQLKPVTTSQVSGSFAGQISANDSIDADKFSSNGSKPVIFNAMATAAEKQTPVQENRGRVAGSDLTETLDAE